MVSVGDAKPESGLRRRLLGNAGSATVLSAGITTVATIATGVLSARLLDVADRGVFSASLAFCTVLGFLCVSGTAEVLVLGPDRGLDETSVGTFVWAYSVSTSLACSIPAALYVRRLDDVSTPFLIASCSLPVLAVIGGIIAYDFVREGRYLLSALVRTTPVLVQIVGMLVVWLTGTASLTSLMLVSAGGSLVAVAIGSAVSRPWRRVALRRPQKLKKIVAIAASTGAAQVVRALSSRIDIVVVSLVLSTTAAGLFSVASSLTVAGTALIASLAPVLLSRSREGSTGVTTVASALAFLIGLGIVAVGPMLLPIVYGPDYRGLQLLVFSLVGSMLALVVFELASRVLQQDGRERAALIGAVVAVVSQSVLVYTLCVTVGLFAAPLGTMTGYLAGLVVLVWADRKHQGDSLIRRVSPWHGVVFILGRARGRGDAT